MTRSTEFNLPTTVEVAAVAELSHCDLRTGWVCIRYSRRRRGPRVSFACGAMLSPMKLSTGDPRTLTMRLRLRTKTEWRLPQEAWARHPPLEAEGLLVVKTQVSVVRLYVCLNVPGEKSFAFCPSACRCCTLGCMHARERLIAAAVRIGRICPKGHPVAVSLEGPNFRSLGVSTSSSGRRWYGAG